MAIFRMKVLVKGLTGYDDKILVDSQTGRKVFHNQVDLYGCEGKGADFKAGIDVRDGDESHQRAASAKLKDLVTKSVMSMQVAVLDLVSIKGKEFYSLVGFEQAQK